MSVALGDGRPPLLACAVALIFAGALGVFLAVRGEFLPHDLAALTVELEAVADGRVAAFMIHDRAAYGGSLIAVGTLYLWLIAVPLSEGRGWAWWTLVLTGGLGFVTNGAGFIYGYVDAWHFWGQLAMFPLAVIGAARSRTLIEGDAGAIASLRPDLRVLRRAGRGWQLAALVGAGLVIVGAVISTVGLARTFVASDLEFIGVSATTLDRIDPRLVPVIAHDRVGFGAAILVGGLLATSCAAHAAGRSSLWDAMCVAAVAAFGPAIVVHHAVGYTDPFHLAPAYVAAAVMSVALALSRPGRTTRT